MKKLLVAFTVVAAVALTSCKKEYTCECTVEDTSMPGSTITASVTIKDTKKKATDACEKDNSTVGTIKTTCKIK